MNEVVANRVCPWCQSELTQAAKVCWKCGLALRSTAIRGNVSVGGGPANPISTHPQSLFTFGLSSLFLTTAFVAVAAALVAALPGFGIGIAILLAPPLVRTWLVVGRKRQLGQQVGAGQKILLYFGSVATTFIITSVVTVASVGTFCGTCLGLAGLSGGSDSSSFINGLIVASGLLTLTVVCLLLWAFSKWIRARWRRDTRDDYVVG